MSNEEKIELLKEVKRLYEVFKTEYRIEGSRVTQSSRISVYAAYNRFAVQNEKLPEEDRIKSDIKLQYTA